MSSPSAMCPSARSAKRPYCTIPIYPSVLPSSWIMHIGIFTVLSAILSRGPCACIRWGGVCICRGAPAFSKRSPSRQFGVYQGAVNFMSRFLITCLSKARMGNKVLCPSRIGDGVRYCRQYRKRRNSDVRNIDTSVACG